MFISGNTILTDSFEDPNRLVRRKGGGGHGGGGRSSGGKGGSSGSKGGSSAAKSHGASTTFENSRSGGKTIQMAATGSPAYAYADGGGKRIVLGSNSPFNGREAGGGDRNAIYGTSHFGSGYPYGGYGSFVSSRPLPYQFYPVPVSYGYYGGDEYLNTTDSERPGGKLVIAIVQSSFNPSSVTYRLVGDNSSVVEVFDALVANCSVVNSTSVITAFTPSNGTWPLPEQIVQYYRASSFALALDSFNNTASLLVYAPTSNGSSPVQMADTPLPSGLNMTFLECVNTTIGASVPLVEVPAKKKLSGTQIAEIVIGSILGIIFIFLIACACCDKRRRCWSRHRTKRQEKKQNAGFGVAPVIKISKSMEDKNPPSAVPFTTSFPEPKARPTSADGSVLAAEPIGDKSRLSYSSSSASFETNVNDGGETQDPDKPSWLTRIPFVGRRLGYRSVKPQSTSSIEMPLSDRCCPPFVEGARTEHASIRSPPRSFSPSPPSSRFPPPSPYDMKFPSTRTDDKHSAV